MKKHYKNPEQSSWKTYMAKKRDNFHKVLVKNQSKAQSIDEWVIKVIKKLLEVSFIAIYTDKIN